MARYVTEFHLTNPVNDWDAAREYLQADDMTQYLINDIDYWKLTRLQPSDIVNIEWDLQDEQYGLIYLDTAIDLTDDELAKISNWVRGQNSDGLGEGFEQQPFAEVRYEGDNYDDDYSDYDTDMASFDWETNNYSFEKVSDSQRVNDFYYNDKSGTMRNYSDLSEQEKQNELMQTYVYAFSYMMNNLDSYIDTTNDRAVKDYIAEQVYVFMDNDPMFDKDQIVAHGINYDNGFTEDLIDFLYNIFLSK